MTWIRIDPNEMETATNELSSCAQTIGDTMAGLQAQAADATLPPAVASQVESTLATVQRQLYDIRLEVLLEAVILAVRGILAAKGSPVAGTMDMGQVPAPTTGFVGGGSSGLYAMGSVVGGNLITDGITSGSSGTATIGGNVLTNGITSGSSGMSIVGGRTTPGFTITNPDGTPANPAVFSGLSVISKPTALSAFGLDPRIGGGMSSGSSFLGPQYTPGMSNTDLANSSIRGSDGIPMNQDPNPFDLDPELFDNDPSTRPPDR